MRSKKKTRRIRLALVCLLIAELFGLAWQRDLVDPLRPFLAKPGSVTLFVVLDTVRADHLSACGYPRPTSPTLERLVEEGASLNCQGIAPGSWTLPSHASFFTGAEVPVHRSHSVAGGESLGQDTAEQVRPLDEELPTLAEAWEGQSALVSGNPVLGVASGLTRGFDRVRTPRHFGEWYGPRLVDQVRNLLRFDTDGRPLLLVVNIADAHGPWLEVDSSVDWASPREAFRYQPAEEGSLWRRYLAGQLENPDAFREQITDLYDVAIWRADHTLAAVLQVLEDYGRSVDRLVLVSDHGEMLGEEGLIDHGHLLNEGNQLVPVLDTASELPIGPLNAIIVHDLLSGQRRDRPLRAAAYPHPQRASWCDGAAFGTLMARSWDPPLWWREGDPLPSGDFGVYVQAVQASNIADGPPDPELTEQLRAAGYLE